VVFVYIFIQKKSYCASNAPISSQQSSFSSFA